MVVVENTPHRLVLSSGLGLEVAWLVPLAVVGAFIPAEGVSMLFTEAANLFAPGWAEEQGWSGARWYWGSGESTFSWHVDGGKPLPRIVSFFVSLSVLLMGLFPAATVVFVLFNASRRLVFDFDSGQATLVRSGLFRCWDRVHAFSDVTAWVTTDADEDGTSDDLVLTASRPGCGRSVTRPQWRDAELLRLEVATVDKEVRDRLVREFSPVSMGGAIWPAPPAP